MKNFLTDKQEITAWLDKYGIENYILIEDKIYGFVVNVEGNVDLAGKKLDNIPVKFNVINGNFYCFNNHLKSLMFCSTNIGKNFDCSYNRLSSLEFCPQKVGHGFYCHNNKITSLEFCPTTIGEHFDCSNNHLKSLKFCPTTIGRRFYCNENVGLLETQNITKFAKIFKIHQETLIKIEQEKLSQQLKNTAIKLTDKITFKV